MPQLHEIFSQEPTLPPPQKAVSFKAIAKTRDGALYDVEAILVLVESPEVRRAIRDAELALREEYKPATDSVSPPPIPGKARADEETYQMLVRALRVPEDPRRPLSRTVLELRNALPAPVAAQLITAYNEWLEAEFPDTMTMAALRALEEEAAKKSEAAPH